MKISYLVTCSNETDTLERLLNRIHHYLGNDELVIVWDTKVKNPKGRGYVSMIIQRENENGHNNRIKVVEHELNKDYSAHKNYGLSLCTGDFVFQLDGDELPTEILLENVHSIIEMNPTTDLFWIPRINDFRGVTPEHARQWGWKLTESQTYKRPIVNWPDSQGRLFKRIPKIRWVGKLHERIEGNETYAFLPFDEELAIYHDKTIEKQVETNLRYNKEFTESDNRGFTLPPN